MIEHIKNAIQQAKHNEKTVTIHFMFLKYANELDKVNPKQFCKDIGILESYETELRKMCKLAKFIEVGIRLTHQATTSSMQGDGGLSPGSAGV